MIYHEYDVPAQKMEVLVKSQSEHLTIVMEIPIMIRVPTLP